MKLTTDESLHYQNEMNISALVKECYTLRCLEKRLTPRKLHALCQLTWWSVNWKTTRLPAIWTLWDLSPPVPAVSQPMELTQFGIPARILNRVDDYAGISNFYTVYRGSSRKWIQGNFKSLFPLVHQAARLTNDDEARSLAYAIQEFEGIPKPSGSPGRIGAASLLTPLVAMLDPRLRFPIINKNPYVVRFHRSLGIASDTLPDQFNTLRGWIGQFGIKNALMLDVLSYKLAKRHLQKPTLAALELAKAPDRELDEKDDSDVERILRTRSRKSRRLHNSMTNALAKLCRDAGLDVREGSEPNRFDALIKDYDRSGRDLLIEAKGSIDRSNLRLAVGQLLDYRRTLKRRSVTDLSVLLPSIPDKDSIRYLADVGVQLLWFNDSNMKKLSGDVRIRFV